jgi:carbamoylphosphate synthase large subunit
MEVRPEASAVFRRVPTDAGATLYLVAPDSLRTWFAHFAMPSEDDEFVYTGDSPRLEFDAIMGRLGGARRAAVLLSSHETLLRDADLGRRLRRHGVAAFAQSPRCARIGADKFVMKHFFEEHGFPSPTWAAPATLERLGRSGRPVVVKRRYGTQSEGTRLSYVNECALAPDELCEFYLAGTEYSVLLYRDEHGDAVFPPVWKGVTSTALVPPWRRLRLCPDSGLDQVLDRELREMTREIARKSDCQGFMEAEYVVTEAKDISILEINPRVSGTMRIAAMATGAAIFAMHKLPDLRGDLPARRWSAELPYAGEPFSDPAGEAFATSRLTIAAPSAADLQARLATFDPSATRHGATL